jgi:hypothetical protein
MFFFLRATSCVLCPLHQDRYEDWCKLCDGVMTRRYGWNARPIPWWVEPFDGKDGKPIRPCQRALDALRN